MLSLNHKTFEDWQDYFETTFRESNQFERKELGIKNTVFMEAYISKDSILKTKIEVHYFTSDGALISMNITNPLTPGYNKLLESEFFYQYDYTPDKSYGAPGLEFSQVNLEAIDKEVKEGLKGKEIKYYKDNKHIRSDVYIHEDKQEIPWTVYFDGSSFWSRLIRNLFSSKNNKELIKQEILLKTIFRGLNN